MSTVEAVYGRPDPALAPVGAEAVQLSPLMEGTARIEDLADGSLQRITIAAPPGAIERPYVLAHGLRALAAGGELIAMAPKSLGGQRIRAELTAFGCDVAEDARRHQRICRSRRPPEPNGLTAAIAAGAPQRAPKLGLWSQPGIFSWDRLDPGTEALIASRLDFTGRIADLGCGAGALGLDLLSRAGVTELFLVDLDRRAVDAASRNIDDTRARFIQADVQRWAGPAEALDAVVTNPPFHAAGRAQIQLGQAFVAAAARMLRAGGRLRMVANVALPYEAVLAGSFSRTAEIIRRNGFKVLEAVK